MAAKKKKGKKVRTGLPSRESKSSDVVRNRRSKISGKKGKTARRRKTWLDGRRADASAQIYGKKKAYALKKNSFADVIRDRLHELGCTPYDLVHCDEMTVSPSTVYRYLSGYTKPVSESLEEILHALGLGIVKIDARPSCLDYHEQRVRP